MVYALFSEAMQYPAIRKFKGLTKKPIINNYLAEIISIIDRLLATVDKGYDI